MYEFKKKEKTVIFKGNSVRIENIFELPRLGAGHDGIVFRYNDQALKVLKYDIDTRKQKDLMTFNKALYFAERLSLKRFVAPQDILLDTDGVYCGYSMQFLDDVTLEKKKGTPKYKTPSSFTCGDLINSMEELHEDVNILSDNRVQIQDFNRGSYIFTSDFMHVCDMDKFRIFLNSHSDLRTKNESAFNFLIAKFLYFEMIKAQGKVTKEQLSVLNKWVKRSCNSRNYFDSIVEEIGSDYTMSIAEYASMKVKGIIK